MHGQIQRVFSRSLDFPGDLGFSVLVDRCPDGIQHLQFTYPSLDRQTDTDNASTYTYTYLYTYQRTGNPKGKSTPPHHTTLHR